MDISGDAPSHEIGADIKSFPVGGFGDGWLILDADSSHLVLNVSEYIRKCWVRANRALRGLDGSRAPRGLRA